MTRFLLVLIFAFGAQIIQPLLAQDTYQYQAGNITVPPASSKEAKAEFSIERAVKHLNDGAIAWSKQKKCVSCHTNGSYLFVRPALSKSLGKPSDEMRNFFVEQLESFKKIGARKLKRSGTRPAQVIYIAAGLAEWDAHVTKKLSAETDAALRLTFEIQNQEGTWHSLTCWPPFESSAFHEATVAAMAAATAPGWLKGLKPDDPVLKNVEALKKYVRETSPPHAYGRVLRLWTSLRMDGILTAEQQQEVVALIQSKQQSDGGWSIRQFAKPEEWGGGNRAEKIRQEKDFENPASDGHMTGLALLVLDAAGVAKKDARMKKGIDWIKSNQRASGRWWTQSLNTEKWHFITYSGTAYSLLAIQNAE